MAGPTSPKVFPIRALADGMEHAFNPFTAGAGFNGQDIRTLAIWTAVGIFLMLRFLRRPQGEVRMSVGSPMSATGRTSVRPVVRFGRF